MYKYDIPYAKPGQLMLLLNGIPINVSKHKNYLIEKMKAHRDQVCDEVLGNFCAEYRIVDLDGAVYFARTFQADQRGNAKSPYHKEKEASVNYIKQNGFNLIADSDGNIITDTELLKFLYDVRYHNRIPVMITNDALVNMATYKPTTKTEFVQLKGLGLRTYEICGLLFIKAISDFCREYPSARIAPDKE